MIHGYARATVNEYGLQEMSEIALSARPDDLHELAAFIDTVAAQLAEGSGIHANWHRHIADALAERLRCDVVICIPDEPISEP